MCKRRAVSQEWVTAIQNQLRNVISRQPPGLPPPAEGQEMKIKEGERTLKFKMLVSVFLCVTCWMTSRQLSGNHTHNFTHKIYLFRPNWEHECKYGYRRVQINTLVSGWLLTNHVHAQINRRSCSNYVPPLQYSLFLLLGRRFLKFHFCFLNYFNLAHCINFQLKACCNYALQLRLSSNSNSFEILVIPVGD